MVVMLYGLIMVFGVLCFSGFLIGVDVWMDRKKERKINEEM